MSAQTPPSSAPTIMDSQQAKQANNKIVQHLESTMTDSSKELGGLRLKLSVTYWVIIGLSVIMFAVGIVLLSVPIWAGFTQIDQLGSLIAGGFGIADLAALFLFKPIERIHKIMGDMSQIIMALNSYQIQVGLTLMEMDVNNRPSMGVASEKIKTAAESSIKLVQDYFEAREGAA